jgi:HEAT repeat protein
MEAFRAILAEIQQDCGWEQIPYDKIAALARLCGPAEVDHLIDTLDGLDDVDLWDDAGDMGDEYWRLRIAYSQTLAGVGESAVEPLLHALSRENPKTRVYAARALGLIGTPRAFEPIVTLLAQETDAPLRIPLIEVLGQLRDERAVAVLLPYLTAAERANRGWIVRMAANALGQLGSEAVIGPLAEVLAADADWFARLGAAEGLRKMQHPRAVDALRSALGDGDSRVAAEAAAGFEEMSDTGSTGCVSPQVAQKRERPLGRDAREGK